MEFYLTKDKHVEMRLVENERKLVSKSNIVIKLESVVKPINDSEDSYCKLLATSLVENACVFKYGDLKGDEICRYLKLELTLPKSTEDNKGSIRIFSSGDVEGSGVSGANIFERLGNVLEYERVKVNVKLEGYCYTQDPDKHLNIVKDDLTITTLEDVEVYGCECTKVEFPAYMSGPLEGELPFYVKLTISVTLNDDAVSVLYLEQLIKSEQTKHNRVALEEAVWSDLVIVASNGAEVKCHKSFLAVRSAVFKAMFESQMKETLTNSIDLDDMSESGVRAFLAFIYHWDMKAASKDCDIAYELYCAGHKYAIAGLENAIGKLICAKPNKWFDVDMTVKLLLFTKNVKDDKKETEELFKKSVQVLKWINKSSPMKLFNSVEYQQIFQKNPKLAMEVSSHFLSWDD